MRIPALIVKTTASVAVLVGCLSFAAPTVSLADAVEDGKSVAFDRKKGNCLACHAIKGGDLAGNIGPELVDIAKKFKKEDVASMISDKRKTNPNTIMPPFGAHQILSKDELNLVVEYIYTL
jgi:sulfur-oxidizing protein SoxX